MNPQFTIKVYKVDSFFKRTTVYDVLNNGKIIGESTRTANHGLRRCERREIHEQFLKENGFSVIID